MKIKVLNIGAFGKIKNFKLDFENGLNIIYGQNEAGKSTMQAFIKAMFYGMNSQKKSVKENDRKKYLPWDSSRAYGSIIFEESNKEYIIIRSFGSSRKEDECEIYNNTTGEKVLHVDIDCPGKSIFGIGEEAFEKTIFIKQLGAEVKRDNEDEIMKRLINLEKSGDSDVSYFKAIKLLEDGIKKINNVRKNGKLDILNNELHTLLLEREEVISLHEENINNIFSLSELKKEKDNLIIDITSLEINKNHIRRVNMAEELEIIKKQAEEIGVLKDEIKVTEQYFNFNKDMLELDNLEKLKYNFITSLEKNNDCKNKKDEMDNVKKLLRKKTEVVQDYKLYSSLDKDIERKVVTLDIEKRELELKLKEIGELENQIDSLKSEVSSKDNTFSNKDLDLKHEGMQNRFIMSIAIALSLIGLILGYAIDKNICLLSVVGAGIYAYYFIKLKKAYNQKDVYYKDMQQQIDVDKVKLEEKLKQLEYYNKDQLEDKYNKNKKYIDFLFNYCKVKDVEQFISSLNDYKANTNEINELMKKEQYLANLLKNLQKDIMEEQEKIVMTLESFFNKEISSKLLQYYKGRIFDEHFQYEAQETIASTINIVSKKLQYYKDNLTKLNALEENRSLLLRGRTIDELEAVLAKLQADDDHVCKYDNEHELDVIMREKNNELIQKEKAIKDVERDIYSKFIGKKELSSIDEDIERVKEKTCIFNIKLKEINMAKEILKEAFEDIQKNFSPKLNEKFSEIVGSITEEKYSSLMMAEDYNISIVEPKEEKYKEIGYFSKGTCDQIYFALRIALVMLIFEEKDILPLILDDAFIQYDDNRLKNVLYFLLKYSLSHQVILFSCHERESNILAEDEVAADLQKDLQLTYKCYNLV